MNSSKWRLIWFRMTGGALQPLMQSHTVRSALFSDTRRFVAHVRVLYRGFPMQRKIIYHQCGPFLTLTRTLRALSALWWIAALSMRSEGAARGHVETSATAFSLERDEVGGRSSAAPRPSLIKDGYRAGLPFPVAFDTIVFSRVARIGALRGGISMRWLWGTNRYVWYLFRLYLAIKKRPLSILFFCCFYSL